jgi:putative transposase
LASARSTSTLDGYGLSLTLARSWHGVAALTGQGKNLRHACRFLRVSESGYYAWRSRPTWPRALRRIFLAGQIVEVHRDSAGVYGAHRITAELRFGRQIIAGHNAVSAIMRELGIKGLPNRRLPAKRPRGQGWRP